MSHLIKLILALFLIAKNDIIANSKKREIKFAIPAPSVPKLAG